MIQSMTGFGKAETEFRNRKITIEIKSLNGKQFDVNLRIPAIYKDKEMAVRNMLFQTIERGKVDFLVFIDTADKSLSSRFDQSAIENYYKEIKEIARNLTIDLPSDWFSVLLRLPEAIKTDVTEVDENEWTVIEQTIREALNTFVEFRTQEGAMLEKLFISKINAISQLVQEIDVYETERIEKIKSRLRESLQKSEIKYDENRFEQELIYYIERLDINEEKSRLINHLNYFLETLNEGKNPGRKLGFIVQEIGREINTLGSKSNHAAMQKMVVQMKDELEQIKEQILNVL
jgi:uncharacterized protein (TIGR00255 family)